MWLFDIRLHPHWQRQSLQPILIHVQNQDYQDDNLILSVQINDKNLHFYHPFSSDPMYKFSCDFHFMFLIIYQIYTILLTCANYFGNSLN